MSDTQLAHLGVTQQRNSRRRGVSRMWACNTYQPVENNSCNDTAVHVADGKRQTTGIHPSVPSLESFEEELLLLQD